MGIVKYDIWRLTVLCNSELAELMHRWYLTPAFEDGFISGVLADYVEENIDELLYLGNTKGDLFYLINRMRQRFKIKEHNIIPYSDPDYPV